MEVVELAIVTVHLVSLDSQIERENQLQRCARYLQGYSSSLLVGDFNFDDKRNHPRSTDYGYLYNDCLTEVLPDYVDVWNQLRPGERGATFNTNENWWSA